MPDQSRSADSPHPTAVHLPPHTHSCRQTMYQHSQSATTEHSLHRQPGMRVLRQDKQHLGHLELCSETIGATLPLHIDWCKQTKSRHNRHLAQRHSTVHCRHHSHRMHHQHTAQSQQPYQRPSHLHTQSSSMQLVPRSSAGPWCQHQMQMQTHMSPSHSEQHESSHRTSQHSSDQSPSIVRDLQCIHRHQKRRSLRLYRAQSQHTSSRCSTLSNLPCQHHKMLLCTMLMWHRYQSTSHHCRPSPSMRHEECSMSPDRPCWHRSLLQRTV